MAGRGAVVTGAPDREAGATEPSSSADLADNALLSVSAANLDASTRVVSRGTPAAADQRQLLQHARAAGAPAGARAGEGSTFSAGGDESASKRQRVADSDASTHAETRGTPADASRARHLHDAAGAPAGAPVGTEPSTVADSVGTGSVRPVAPDPDLSTRLSTPAASAGLDVTAYPKACLHSSPSLLPSLPFTL